MRGALCAARGGREKRGAGEVTRVPTRLADARVSALPAHDLATESTAACGASRGKRAGKGARCAVRGAGVQRAACSVKRET